MNEEQRMNEERKKIVDDLAEVIGQAMHDAPIGVCLLALLVHVENVISQLPTRHQREAIIEVSESLNTIIDDCIEEEKLMGTTH